MSKPSLSPDMEVEDLVGAYPELVPILTSRGVICIQCGAPIWGTLSEAVIKVGQDPAQVMEALNQALQAFAQGS